MSENLSKYANFAKAKKKSFAGLTDTVEDQGLENVLMQLAAGSGWNPIYSVNDLDNSSPLDEWTESDSGTFDVSSAAADNRVATNALQLTGTAATDGTQYVETRYIDGGSLPQIDFITGHRGMDWRDSNYVGFWLSAAALNDYNADGELQFAIVNRESGSDVVQTKHDVQAAVNAIHQRVEIDISDDNRDNVVAVRFYSNNLATGEAVELDSMIRYRLGNGKGPAVGQTIILPVVDGQTVTKGDIVSIEVADPFAGMAVQPESAVNQVNDIGVACGTGTGTSNGSVTVPVQVSGLCYLRANAATVAGEGLIWQSDDATYGHLVEGVATGAEEYSFARCYEAAGAQYDDILCWILQSNVYIS